jgi:hypothetical protein
MSPKHQPPHNHTTPQDPFQNRTKRFLPSFLTSPLRAEDYIRTSITALPKRKRGIDTNEQERVDKAAKLDAAYEADDEDEEGDVGLVRVPNFEMEISTATAGTWRREVESKKGVVEQEMMGLERKKEMPWDKDYPVLGEKPWNIKYQVLQKSEEEQFGLENGFESEGKGGWAVVSARSDPWNEVSVSGEESVFEEEEAGFWEDDDEGRMREEVDGLEKWECEWRHVGINVRAGDRYTVLDVNQDRDILTVEN